MTNRQIYDFFNQQGLMTKSDLRSLLEFRCKKNFAEILTSEEQTDPALFEQIKNDIIKIQEGYPLPYILGEQDFFKSKFYVNPDVLIPRFETEYLVELISKDKDFKNYGLIMDIGAGSGCIGISLLNELSPLSQCIFVEKSLKATEILKANLKKHKIESNRYQIFLDLNDVPKGTLFDLIVSNPPYIDEKDQRVEQNVRLYEPQMALFADDQGFFYLKNWSEWSMNHLKKGCKVFFEFGLGQEVELGHYCQKKNWNYQILKDQYNVDRFLVLECKG